MPGKQRVLEVFLGLNAVNGKHLLYLPDEPRPLVEIGVGEDVDEGSFDLREDIFGDVIQKYPKWKQFFDLLGAYIIPIEGHVGEVIDLRGQSVALTWEHQGELLHFVAFSIEIYIKLVVEDLYGDNERVVLLKSQAEGLKLVVADRLALELKEVDEEFEDF